MPVRFCLFWRITYDFACYTRFSACNRNGNAVDRGVPCLSRFLRAREPFSLRNNVVRGFSVKQEYKRAAQRLSLLDGVASLCLHVFLDYLGGRVSVLPLVDAERCNRLTRFGKQRS